MCRCKDPSARSERKIVGPVIVLYAQVIAKLGRAARAMEQRVQLLCSRKKEVARTGNLSAN